jgi:hypothetical protein
MTLTEDKATGRNKCMLNDALLYLKLGWSIIPACWPVDGKCGCGKGHTANSIGKAPLPHTWKVYQSRLPTTVEVTRWWTDAPLANIACITGAISGFAAVDLEHEGLEWAARAGVHSSLTSITGKGRHLLFQHPGERVCNAVAKGKIRGLDIRGDGGYIMLPPSMHVNGKRYQWLSKPYVGIRMSTFPAEKLSVSVGNAASGTGAPLSPKPAGWIAEALRGLSNGNRNDTFASVVGRMHRDRWTPDDIRAVLLPHALRVEFPERELDTVIWSITRKPVIINGRGAQVGSGTGQPVQPVAKLVLRTFGGDMGEYENRKLRNRKLDFPTGYTRFDEITTGLQRGELLVIGARTETGKTNLLLGCAYGLCERAQRVLLLSTEMSFDRIWDRYLCLGSGATVHPLIVCDDFTPDIGRIREAIIESAANVIIFDHINIVGDDNETISTFLKGLKELAREFNVPGIVAAQLNRQAEWKDQEGNPIEPELRHLKGSGSIEETAAQVLLLQVKEDGDDAKFIQGFIRKNRYGEKGIVDFVLRKKPYRMEEL